MVIFRQDRLHRWTGWKLAPTASLPTKGAPSSSSDLTLMPAGLAIFHFTDLVHSPTDTYTVAITSLQVMLHTI